MRVSEPTFGWNELDFLDSHELRQMGPAIIRLEIDRLSEVLRSQGLEPESSDCVRRARYELKTFADSLETDAGGAELAPRLEVAAINLAGVLEGTIEPDAVLKVGYVLDRVQYLRNRISLLY